MSHKVVPLRREEAHALQTARVQGGSGGVFIVDTGAGTVGAAPAVSCLVAPRPGDRVLLSRGAGECFILAVLEREDSAVSLSFPGDVEFAAPHGKLGVSVRDGFSLASDSVSARAGAVSLALGSVHSVVGLINQRAQAVMRWVEGAETLNVGNWVQNVRSILNVRAHQAVISARKDVKIDGERIHMG